MALRKLLDSVEPLFSRGGKLEKYYSLFEMVDTLLYSPPNTTPHAPHARDALDLKRVMITVVIAATPAAMPPPPTARNTASGGSGSCWVISTPIVPWPAMTSSSSKG